MGSIIYIGHCPDCVTTPYSCGLIIEHLLPAPNDDRNVQYQSSVDIIPVYPALYRVIHTLMHDVSVYHYLIMRETPGKN